MAIEGHLHVRLGRVLTMEVQVHMRPRWFAWIDQIHSLKESDQCVQL